jgi:hypothetical protein
VEKVSEEASVVGPVLAFVELARKYVKKGKNHYFCDLSEA